VARGANFKRLPPVKGAPAERVRDCYTIILDELQIGSIAQTIPTASHLPLLGGG